MKEFLRIYNPIHVFFWVSTSLAAYLLIKPESWLAVLVVGFASGALAETLLLHLEGK